MSEIGDRIRASREEMGFSQRELAGPGVSPSCIRRIEAGERRPTLRILRQIGLRLGVTPEWLRVGATLSDRFESEGFSENRL